MLREYRVREIIYRGRILVPESYFQNNTEYSTWEPEEAEEAIVNDYRNESNWEGDSEEPCGYEYELDQKWDITLEEKTALEQAHASWVKKQGQEDIKFPNFKAYKRAQLEYTVTYIEEEGMEFTHGMRNYWENSDLF